MGEKVEKTALQENAVTGKCVTQNAVLSLPFLPFTAKQVYKQFYYKKHETKSSHEFRLPLKELNHVSIHVFILMIIILLVAKWRILLRKKYSCSLFHHTIQSCLAWQPYPLKPFVFSRHASPQNFLPFKLLDLL